LGSCGGVEAPPNRGARSDERTEEKGKREREREGKERKGRKGREKMKNGLSEA
jgi:hypothetical protein